MGRKRKKPESDDSRSVKARIEETNSGDHLDLNRSSEKKFCTTCGERFINSEALNFHILNKKSNILKFL